MWSVGFFFCDPFLRRTEFGPEKIISLPSHPWMAVPCIILYLCWPLLYLFVMLLVNIFFIHVCFIFLWFYLCIYFLVDLLYIGGNFTKVNNHDRVKFARFNGYHWDINFNFEVISFNFYCIFVCIALFIGINYWHLDKIGGYIVCRTNKQIEPINIYWWWF